MSTQIASSSSLPELPPEIWLKIFRIATIIPRETDVSATTVERGLLCSKSEYKKKTFDGARPLRCSVALVSRRFYQIGVEVLYTTFHASTLRSHGLSLSIFSDLLVSRPELGRFIRRLSLEWSKREEEANYQIISRCPNVTIFSSFLSGYNVCNGRWWRVGLPKTI